MTTRPTLEANKGVGSVLTSSEWNTNVLQQGNWTQEVLLGTNSDKIPGSSLNAALAIPGKLTFASGVALASADWGMAVNSGLYMQWNTPTGAGGWQWSSNGSTIATLTPAGALTLSSTLSTTGIVSSGAWPSGQTLQESGSITANGAATSGITITYSGGSPNPYGFWTVNLNGNTRRIGYFA